MMVIGRKSNIESRKRADGVVGGSEGGIKCNFPARLGAACKADRQTVDGKDYFHVRWLHNKRSLYYDYDPVKNSYYRYSLKTKLLL